MQLACSPGVNHHSKVASLFPDKEKANCGGDPAAKGHKAASSESQQKALSELAVGAKQWVPEWLDEADTSVDMLNLLAAEAQQVEVEEDATHFRRSDTPYVLRSN